MKLLDVSGVYSYGAMEFEKIYNKDDFLDLWEKANNKEDKKLIIKKTLDEGTINEHKIELHIEAHSFNEVDEDFIKYIRDEIQDYDQAKHHNFYIIKEE